MQAGERVVVQNAVLQAMSERCRRRKSRQSEGGAGCKNVGWRGGRYVDLTRAWKMTDLLKSEATVRRARDNISRPDSVACAPGLQSYFTVEYRRMTSNDVNGNSVERKW